MPLPSGKLTLELGNESARTLEAFAQLGTPAAELEILLPVHNEAGSIEKTMREIYQEISPKVPVRFIICEDGSTDDTRDVLARLEKQLPGRYITSPQRKGYSKAVKDGMATIAAPYLLCLDGDGQCDPADFWTFWNARNDADFVIGWRTKRSDPFFRRALSRLFYIVYQLIYRAPIHDPSCPFILIKRQVVDILLPTIGCMREGYWWEFTARARRAGFSMKEFPVHHRERSAGKTQVYRLRKLAGIGVRHFAALASIWFQTRSGPSRP